ncbi:MAG: DMT family transporter [Methylophilaceae bacterium]
MNIIVSNGNNKNTFAVFGLLFGACFWGVVWYPYRLMGEAGVSGVASSFYTYLIAFTIALAVYAKHWRGMFTLPKSIVWLSLVAGWTNLAYVLAVLDNHVMRVILLFYLSPLWTLILAHFWLKERTNTKGVFTIVVALLGASIMLYDSTGQSGWLPIPRSISDWLALSSGIGFAISNVISRKSSHLSIIAKSFAVWIGVVVMAVICIPFVNLPFPSPSFFTLNHWLIMTIIALVLFFGTMLVQYGVTQIEANRASVIFLFELIIAALASYFLAGEVMTVHELVGGLLIVAAAFTAATNENVN